MTEEGLLDKLKETARTIVDEAKEEVRGDGHQGADGHQGNGVRSGTDRMTRTSGRIQRAALLDAPSEALMLEHGTVQFYGVAARRAADDQLAGRYAEFARQHAARRMAV